MNTKQTVLEASERVLKEAAQFKNLYLARIIEQHKELFKVLTEKSENLAQVSGKLRYENQEKRLFPVVGDFVMIDRDTEDTGNAIIHHILKRKSQIVRSAAGTSLMAQVIASNVDIIFVCMSLNNDFNTRRLERYLAICWDSGAIPVVVLTKSDLCDDIKEKIDEVFEVAFGVDVLITSQYDKESYQKIFKYIAIGKTVAFIGSSGVGKSSLINRILGNDYLKTNEIRQDDKGRHTTTHRELIYLPGGGAVIDTPGMREIGIESADLNRTFSDIDELAQNCRFNDCRHDKEPGCAVRAAIENGDLSEERLDNYNKLKKEMKYETMSSKEIDKEKTEEMYAEFEGKKNARDYVKSKKKYQN